MFLNLDLAEFLLLGMSEQNISFSKKDLFSTLFIGEAAAWLIIILAKGLAPISFYEKYGDSLGLFAWVVALGFPLACAVGLYLFYLIGKKISVVYQIGKFSLVGGFNTLVDWGILALLILVFRRYLAIEAKEIVSAIPFFSIAFYSFFKAISFILAATNSYLWNKFWTFKRESAERVVKEFVQFIIVSFIGFLLNVSIASGIFQYIKPAAGLNYDQWAIGAAVMATIISMAWNFLGYKFIVFENEKNS